MRVLIPLFVASSFLSIALAESQPSHKTPVANRAPLAPSALIPLPLGSVQPAGWLKQQLQVAAKGMTGHLEDFWPDVGPNSTWKGGKSESAEREPYYLDGLVPLAYLLNDQRLKDRAQVWIEWMIQSAKPDGFFGPQADDDRWIRAIALKVLTQYYEATGDERALKLIGGYLNWLTKNQPEWPLGSWANSRGSEMVLTCFWYYNRTGDSAALKLAENIFKQAYDWNALYANFPFTDNVKTLGKDLDHYNHIVNVAMSVKYPGLRYVFTKDEQYRKGADHALAQLDKYHGQVGGRISGDEHLAGLRPTQGSELCSIVELMFSMEYLTAALGNPAYGDRLEQLAYNALPGTCTPDFWAHQYDQQANQVICNLADRPWTKNWFDSNIYGVEPNFPCCTANMHQGWPKLVAHLWMASPNGGLAAVAYGPSIVTTTVGKGQQITIEEETDYPFTSKVRLTVRTKNKVSFPLSLRIPQWGSAKIQIGKEVSTAPAGLYHVIEREWRDGDVVELEMPMEVRAEHRFNNSVAISRGPLVFALKIKEHFVKLDTHPGGTAELPFGDWEVYPESPWNYALVLDPRNIKAAVVSEQLGKIPELPFSNDKPPVTLVMPAKKLRSWTIVENSAGDPPPSPVKDAEKTVQNVELIPYGSTRLRVSEFPWVAPEK